MIMNKLTKRNTKAEILTGYCEMTEQLETMKEQQRVLIAVASLLFVFWVL